MRILLALLLIPSLVLAQPLPGAGPNNPSDLDDVCAVGCTTDETMTLTGTLDLSGATTTVDISDQTNLTVTSPITLTDDDIGFDFSTNNTWTGTQNFQGDVTLGVDGSTDTDLLIASSTAGNQIEFDTDGDGTAPLIDVVWVGERYKVLSIDGTVSTRNASTWASPIFVDYKLDYTGTGSIALIMDFGLTDERTVNAVATADYFRINDWLIDRKSTHSASVGGIQQIQAIYLDANDDGNYNSTAALTGGMMGFITDFDATPTFGATAASTYNMNGVLIDFSYTPDSYNANVALNSYGFKYSNSILGISSAFGAGDTTIYGYEFVGAYQFTGGHGPDLDVIGYYFHPTTLTLEASDTAYGIKLDSSGIAIDSDGSQGTYTGGFLRMGEAEEWEQYFTTGDVATNNVPTGDTYAWQVNASDVLTLTATELGVPFGLDLNDVTHTASESGAASDLVHLCDATSGAVTVTLPAVASSGGATVWVKKIDSSGNKCTIDGNTSETIDGSTTIDLLSQYDAVHLYCDGDEWHIL